MLVTLRKIFYLVGRERPGRWALLVIGAAMVSALEMLGAVLVFILLALIADPTGELSVPLVGEIRAGFMGAEQATFLLTAAAVMGAFFVLRLIVQVGFAYVKHRVANNAAARISARLADGYLRLPYVHHLRRKSAELVRNAYQSLDNLASQGFLAAILVVAESILVLGLVIVMMLVAPVATIGAVVVIGTSSVLLLRVVQPRLQAFGERAQEMRKRAFASLQQSLHGIRDIQVSRSEGYFSTAYREQRDELSRSLYLRGTILDLPRLIIETTLVLFILALFSASIATGVANQEILSTLGLFAYAGLRIQPSLQKLVGGLNSIKYAAPSVDEVFADLELIEEIAVGDASHGQLSFDDRLLLEDVSFSYEGSESPAIHDVNLSIRPGEVIGICGPTGGGKTTLVDLITGLIEPTQGRVTVDGESIPDHRGAWFDKLGVVPQMIFLVDDTLRRNIAMGVDDCMIDEEALDAAVQLAQLSEFVKTLPQGLDTVVGERGIRLSGGQRQRVAIARALYRDPDVLILDEGTSALDNATESHLIASLELLRGTRTVFLVAHRLSSVRGCDRLVYVEDGRIADEGKFEDLHQRSEGFRALVDTGSRFD